MIKFGTDGWRAIIGEEFNEQNVVLVTQAFADFLSQQREGGTVFLGFDRRRWSEESAKNGAEILTGNGFTVRLASSYCPTPCIAWNTKTHQARAGMMITASHNPPQWNGIKFKEADGGAASSEQTTAIESMLGKNRPVKRSLSKGRQQQLLLSFDPLANYVHALQQAVGLKKIQQAGWKIGYDPLFGAGAGFLPHALGTDLHQIHGASDPSFGGLNPEPIEKNLSALIRLVREKNLDVGFATDGDADRIGAVDEDGQFVDSHHIFALILRHLVTVWKQSGDVIKTVSTSNMIDRLAEKFHLKTHETPIGFKHICKKFREVRALAGGEESGGIAVTRWMHERDGIFSALLLLEVMSHHRKRLGELVKGLHQEIGPHCFAREDIHLTPAEWAALPPLPRKMEIAGHKIQRINDLDGRKYIFREGWLLIRPSGTEPVLRIYAEAASPDEVQGLLKAGKEIACG